MPQCIDRVQVCCLPCRVNTAGKTNHDPKTNSFSNGKSIGNRDEILGRSEHQGTDGISGKDAQDPSDNTADDPDDCSLVNKHTHHLFFLSADAAHDTNLLDPLVHGHHHNIEDRNTGDNHRNPANSRDKGCDRAKCSIDGRKCSLAVGHADDLVVLVLVELFFYVGFYGCRIPAIDFHDHFIIIAVPVVRIFKPFRGNDKRIVRADIKAHTPLLNDPGDAEGPSDSPDLEKELHRISPGPKADIQVVSSEKFLVPPPFAPLEFAKAKEFMNFENILELIVDDEKFLMIPPFFSGTISVLNTRNKGAIFQMKMLGEMNWRRLIDDDDFPFPFSPPEKPLHGRKK